MLWAVSLVEIGPCALTPLRGDVVLRRMKVRVTKPPTPAPTQMESQVICATIDNARTTALLAFTIAAKGETFALAQVELQALKAAQDFADKFYGQLGLIVEAED